jgi:hypothetical protein
MDRLAKIKSKYFTWKHVFGDDKGDYTFFDCTLLIKIGPFSKGTHIQRLDVDTCKCAVTIEGQTYHIGCKIVED